MIAYEYLALVQVNASGTITDEWLFADVGARDNAEYALVEYAPAVAPLRVSRLGGAGSYDEVTDRLIVHCLGGTPAQAVAAYERLMGALDAAGRWADEEVDTPLVQLRVRTLESTVGELAAVVLGPAPGEAPATVGAAWDQGVGAWVVRDVAIQFRRRGLWLLPTADSTTANATGLNVASLSYSTAASAVSPAELVIRTTSSDGVNDDEVGGFLLAGPAGHVLLQNLGVTGVAGISGSGTWSTVAAATARGGNVKRYTAGAGVTPLEFLFDTTIVPPDAARTLHLFVTARNNSATYPFQVQGGIVTAAGLTVITPAVTIPVNPAAPGGRANAYYLGSVGKATDWAAFKVALVVTAAAGSAGATIDFNVMGVLAESPTSRAVSFVNTRGPLLLDDQRIVIGARAIDGVSPQCAVLATPAGGTQARQNPTYSGDAFVEVQATCDVCLFAVQNTPSYPWQMGTNANTALPLQCTLRRWRGWRTPQ